MKKFLFLFATVTLFVMAVKAGDARWLTALDENVDKPNTWIAFRRDVDLKKKPREAIARIAADTKYWLWVNGELAVFEGGLKRGPNPNDTYYDEVDLAPYLKKGNNKIAILLWHFGKDGFSHKNSGRAGLIFSADNRDFTLVSDSQWQCRVHPAFGTAGEPYPNYRMPESSILFDARRDMEGWQTAGLSSLDGFLPAGEIGVRGDGPWNALVPRPIPQWRDYGIRETEFTRKEGLGVDTVMVSLPYNMQMTPVLDITDNDGGSHIVIWTDHFYGGGEPNIKAEYITRRGRQKHESLGWINGEKIFMTIPQGVGINSIGYRETGYDSYPQGTFICEDDFYNRFWEKALRTLYVNMRDTYFDCPDRERAQWWGDVVSLMGESFYSFSTSSHALMKKAMCELVDWQKPDGVLYSPIPGNFNDELPGQILASIGRYGFWTYYMNTGDRETIEYVYPAVKKYLALWSTDETGLTAFRSGGWTWGDWGDNRDIRLIFAGWHYMALESAANMADLLGYSNEATAYRDTMAKVKVGYNKCWNGYAYRHPSYQKETDDRVQALAVVSGIADGSKYPQILELLKTQFHASPYMEKYVMEALFVMGEGKYAMERTRNRFAEMVDDPNHSTLFEGWGVGEKGFGGGTTNHAWSGGALTVIAQKLCGLSPLSAGWKEFLIEPDPASFAHAAIAVPTVTGLISSEFRVNDGVFELEISVPQNTTAIVRLPAMVGSSVTVNGQQATNKQLNVNEKYLDDSKTALSLTAGKYTIIQK